MHGGEGLGEEGLGEEGLIEVENNRMWGKLLIDLTRCNCILYARSDHGRASVCRQTIFIIMFVQLKIVWTCIIKLIHISKPVYQHLHYIRCTKNKFLIIAEKDCLSLFFLRGFHFLIFFFFSLLIPIY